MGLSNKKLMIILNKGNKKLNNNINMYLIVIDLYPNNKLFELFCY